MTERFFDRYPRFYETTATRLLPNRLQQRWRMMIESNRGIFAGARVLDLASHDGRWSFAALDAGAAYVEGVEARPELVASANQNFALYNISPARYSFFQADVVRFLSETAPKRFDVILNLGFFYHTLKHLEILEGMARLGAKAFVIDTGLSGLPGSNIELTLDAVRDPRNAIDHLDLGRETVPVGAVSREALRMMLDSVGYDCTELDWSTTVINFEECEEYRSGRRGTFLASRKARRL